MTVPIKNPKNPHHQSPIDCRLRADASVDHEVAAATLSNCLDAQELLLVDDYEDYLAELRAHVCSRCIERSPGCPPCAPRGKACGVELHIPELVQMCRTLSSDQMAPYIEDLHSLICDRCSNKDGPTCPCPLDYLLQLAIEAIERVEERHKSAEVADGSNI